MLLKVSSYTSYCTFSAQNLDIKEGGKKSHSRSLMGNFGKHKVSKMKDSVCSSSSHSILETLGMFYCLEQAWCVWGSQKRLCDYAWYIYCCSEEYWLLTVLENFFKMNM